MKNEKITIEKLAVMVQKGFDNTATKTDVRAVSERLDKVIEKHEEEIGSLKGRVKVIEEALEIE